MSSFPPREMPLPLNEALHKDPLRSNTTKAIGPEGLPMILR